MKIVFTQKSKEHYAVFVNRTYYTEMLGHVAWDNLIKSSSSFPMSLPIFLKKSLI